jgi:ABC-type multidrug transport system ATPase subunit
MNLLQIDSLSKSFGVHEVLHDISLFIEPNHIVGLLGKNGAGKTTLIKCIMGALNNYHGSIKICGYDTRSNQDAIRKYAGFMLEPAFCDYISARENIKLLSTLLTSETRSPDELLSLVSLENAAHKKCSTFSFGMKQRLGLAEALLGSPRVLVLDEPFVGLDPTGIALLKKVLSEFASRGNSILFSSHQVEEIEDTCSHVVILDKGRLSKCMEIQQLTETKSVTMLIDSGFNNIDNIQRLIADIPFIRVYDDTRGIAIEVSNARDASNVIVAMYKRGIQLLDIRVTRHSLSELFA